MGLRGIGVTAKDVGAKAEGMNNELGLWDSEHGCTIRHNGRMVETTGGFTSAGLALETQTLQRASLSHRQDVEIGELI